jgi:hypothetical protein
MRLKQLPAVDRDCLAGHPLREGRCREQRHIGDFQDGRRGSFESCCTRPVFAFWQAVGKVKRHKHVATRCAKTAESHAAIVDFARMLILVKSVHGA